MPLRSTAVASKTDEKQQVAVPDTSVSGTCTETIPSWRIFVKTVGKGFDDRRVSESEKESGNIPSVDGSLSFDVTVSPEDRIDFLHDEIEGITGVKASQQRLIYRGRLIGKSDVESISVSHNTSSNSIDDEESRSIENSTSTVTCKEKSGQTSLPTSCKNEHQNDYKIKDIAGLCDGQTIHLVRKRDSETTKTNANNSDAIDERGASNDSRNNESDSNASNNAGRESETGGGGGALLAALLGLETRFSEDGGSAGIGPLSPGTRTDATNNDYSAQTTTNTSVSSPWGPSRTANDADATSSRSPRNNRRPHYRLGTEDLQVSDPGSMESVRQGLMTLYTIMNSQPQQQSSSGRDEEGNTHTDHPLEVNREWFRGQWIDARDTVNQWLEATVAGILDPQDVLNDTATLRNTTTSAAIHSARYGSPENPHQQPRQRRVPNVDNDPAISANDLEGRRRLLLEECEPGDPREIIFDSNTESSAQSSSIQLPVASGSQSFRPRSSNNGVKLLLIHYNGWPHRWDEWIRSDSERLRPFRTRTRHPNTVRIGPYTAIFNTDMWHALCLFFTFSLFYFLYLMLLRLFIFYVRTTGSCHKLIKIINSSLP